MKKILSSLAGGAFLMTAFPLVAEETAAPASGGTGNLAQTVIMIAVALVFFYFILWRPEQKRRKQMEQVRSTLKKGDRITAMGIVGTVVKVLEKSVVVSLYEGAKMEVLKAAITDVQAAVGEEKGEKPAEANESAKS